MSSFHRSVFGRFGEGIFTDLNGFAHTKPEEWMAAPLDAAGGPLTEDNADALAAQSVKQLHDAEAAVQIWRAGFSLCMDKATDKETNDES